MHGTFALVEAPLAVPPSPIFGRRWHSWSRLDIRPVLWSLRNRPEEWRQDEFTLTHIPSKHEFWTASGLFFYGLYRAGCSCKTASNGSFSFIQKIQFGFVRLIFRPGRPSKPDLTEINRQFARHFLPPTHAEHVSNK